MQEAIRDYNRAIEIEPVRFSPLSERAADTTPRVCLQENTTFHYNRAVAFCDQLDYENAIEVHHCHLELLLEV